MDLYTFRKVLPIIAIAVAITMGLQVYVKEVSKPRLNVETDKVSVLENNVEVGFYFERPDLELSERNFSESTLNSELPAEIQIENIYLNDTLCDAARLPHVCKIKYDPSKLTYEIKVTYKTGLLLHQEVSIPLPSQIEKIQILSPLEAPSQNSDFDFSFQDSGADTYLISVSFCGEYQSDNINPCLESKKYSLVRLPNGVIQFADQNKFSPYITVINNVVEIKDETLKMKYEDSVEYKITASKVTQTESGTKLESQSSSELSLEKAEKNLS